MTYKTAKAFYYKEGADFNHIIDWDGDDIALCGFLNAGGLDTGTPIDNLSNVNDLCSKCLTIYYNEPDDTSPVASEDSGSPVYITITNEPDGHYRKTIKVASDISLSEKLSLADDISYHIHKALEPKKHETGQRIHFYNNRLENWEFYYRNDSDGIWRHSPSGIKAYEYRIGNNIRLALADNSEIEFVRAFTY